MPGFDRTGPVGAGPMTGGGRGLCGTGPARLAPRGFRGRGFGRGMGRGRGFGRGLGYGRGFGAGSGYFPAVKPEEEIALLKNEAEYLEKELAAITQRIEEIEKPSSA